MIMSMFESYKNSELDASDLVTKPITDPIWKLTQDILLKWQVEKTSEVEPLLPSNLTQLNMELVLTLPTSQEK